VLALALSACASPRPAQLFESSSSCQQQINAFVTQVAGQPIELDSRAFQDSPTLMLEPSTALKMSGRVLGKPLRFTLSKQHQQCWIESQQIRQLLTDCQCKTP
jgi:hypothetical protein